MIGTMRTTENGNHVWASGVTLEGAIKRFAKLGTVRQRGNRLTVTRFCGGKFRAEFFPKAG